MPITEDIETLTPLLEKLDGVLFSGGSDIDPNLYGEYPRFGLGMIEPKRDIHEVRLAQKVLFETTLPVLGICRGMQLLTVATGGTLYMATLLQGITTIIVTMKDVSSLRSHRFQNKLDDPFQADYLLPLGLYKTYPQL